MAHRLSGMDSSFVSLETATMPQHVIGALVLDTTGTDGGLSFELFRRILLERMHLMGQLRQRLVEVPLGLDHPRFVDDADFDIDRHLHEVTLPAPGGQRELEDLVGTVAGTVLDRSRPLWEMWVVQGMAGERAAVVTKMHHATMDGVTGADLMAHLFDLTPEPRAVAAAPPDATDGCTPPAATGAPTGWQLAVAGLARQATSPPRVVRQLATTTTSVVNAARTVLARRRETTLPMTAPRTRWSGALSDRRAVAFAQLRLDDLRAIRAAAGVKVNDVILAVTTQALREYLAWLGELPGRALVAQVPVSIRADGDDRTNQITTMLAPLPVHLDDPVEVLGEIGRATTASKEMTGALGNDLLVGWSDLVAPALLSSFSDAYARLRLADHHPPLQNAIVSNVQGPPLELWIAGAKVEAVYPMGPLLPGAGVNVTCLSNRGNVDVGILVDGAHVPEPWRIAEALAPAVAALRDAVATVAEPGG